MPVRRGRKGKQGGLGAKQAALTRQANSSSSGGGGTSKSPEEEIGVLEGTTHGTTSSLSGDGNNAQPPNRPLVSSSSSSSSPELILTSDKRRGVYECDYCGSDISQTPRIRCAVCDDFDVCCDCFATTDPVTAVARLRAAHAVAQAAATAAATATTTLTVPKHAKVQHDPLTHGYHVCDSTRYPLFPVKAVAVAVVPASHKTKKTTITATTTSTTSLDELESTDGTEENEFDPSDADDPMMMMDVDSSSKNDGEQNKSETKNTELTAATTTIASTSAAGAAGTLPGVAPDSGVGAGATPRATVTTITTDATAVVMPTGDDMKTMWTVEEDLRLLHGIQTHGLGNWSDIAEAVVGQGSQGKTAKRCMERYFDDFMGRYGHILPPYTLISLSETTTGSRGEDDDNNNNNDDETAMDQDIDKDTLGAVDAPLTSREAGDVSGDAEVGAKSTSGGGEVTRSSKRRSTMLRAPSSTNGTVSAKKYKAVPTESLPEYHGVHPIPYLPKLDTGPVEIGQEVNRDAATKAEQAYVRSIASLDCMEQVERIRMDWEQNRLNKPGGPTVLPMRPDDIPRLPGSELAGFMPRRGDFDIEWENSAEEAIADMEFIPGESDQDRLLKLAVLDIYNSKLDEREKRKQFVLSRKLYNYRHYQQEYQKLPRDERDLVLRMRLFERFHTPEEHQIFIHDLLKAKRLRKEIAKLQMYRRMGIRSLVEAERYELDKARRQFHKTAVLRKNAEAKTLDTALGSEGGGVSEVGRAAAAFGDGDSSQYWKQYRTTDRKIRRSVNRGSSCTAGEVKTKDSPPSRSSVVESPTVALDVDESAMPEVSRTKMTLETDDAETNVPTSDDPMDVEPKQAKELIPSNETKVAAVPMTSHEKETVDNNAKFDDLSHLPGYNLLSSREVDLVRSVQLQPAQYLEIKNALIYQSLTQGLLDGSCGGGDGTKNRTSSGKRGSGRDSSSGSMSPPATLVRMDVERRGTVIDFVVSAGWIPTHFGKAVRANLPS